MQWVRHPPQEEARKTPPKKKPRPPQEETRKTPPPGSSGCWEIRATSGRCASYWNAYLFTVVFMKICTSQKKFFLKNKKKRTSKGTVTSPGTFKSHVFECRLKSILSTQTHIPSPSGNFFFLSNYKSTTKYCIPSKFRNSTYLVSGKSHLVTN